MSAEPAEVEPRRGRRAALSPGIIQALRNCADQLDRSVAMRVGVMDSLSRIEDIQKQQRAIVVDVIRTLRELA